MAINRSEEYMCSSCGKVVDIRKPHFSCEEVVSYFDEDGIENVTACWQTEKRHIDCPYYPEELEELQLKEAKELIKKIEDKQK